jgi:hypothetical protein
MVGALSLIVSTPLSAQPVKEVDPMSVLGVDQLMRVSTLSPARITEMRCAGYGQWLAANRPTNAKSPTRSAAARLSAEVEAAIANDAELSAKDTRDLVAAIAMDAGLKVKDEGDAVLLAEVDSCRPLYSAAASPAPLKLHPLAVPSVVSPAMASCYAQYRLAATLSDGEEAKDFTASANKAHELAVKDKSGAPLAAAEAALEAEFNDLKAAPDSDKQSGMMRLIMCLPAMQEAADK